MARYKIINGKKFLVSQTGLSQQEIDDYNAAIQGSSDSVEPSLTEAQSDDYQREKQVHSRKKGSNLRG